MMNVKKLLEITQLLVNTKELTLEQNHINVPSVENPSVGVPILLLIRELTRVRNPIIVRNVAKLSENVQLLLNMKSYILELSPMNVINVENHVARWLTL